MMEEAASDGEREEDASVPGAGRDVYVPGVHVWSTSVLEIGQGVCSPCTRQEKRSAPSVTGSARRRVAKRRVAASRNRSLGSIACCEGWANYFSLGYVDGSLEGGAAARLPTAPPVVAAQAMAKRGGVSGHPDQRLYEEYNLVNLVRAVRRLPLWAKARS